MAVPAKNEASVLSLEFKDFRTFLNTFSAGISRSGMFVETSETEPVGSEVEFAFVLVGGDSLLQGRGQVVWIAEGDGTDAPGMALRFTEIDGDGERLIERIEEIRTKSGRPIFDVESGSRPEAAAVSPGGPTADLLRAELETLKQEHLEDRARLVADLDTVRAERDRLEARLRTLEATDASATDERDQLLSEKDALRVELESTRGEVGLLEQRVREQEADLARFAEQGRYAMAERDRLENQRKTLAEDLETARADLAKLEEERGGWAESGERLAEAEREAAELRSTETALREQLAEARSQLEEIESRTSDRESELRTELEIVQAERDELRRTLEHGQVELDAVRLQFEESAGRTLELEHEASSLEAQVAEARQEAQAAAAERTKLVGAMKSLRARHDELQSELGARAAAVQCIRDVHDRLESSLADARTALAELQLHEAREGLGGSDEDVFGAVDTAVDAPDAATPLAVAEVEAVEESEAAEPEVSEEPVPPDEPEADADPVDDEGDTVEIDEPVMIIDDELDEAPEPRGLWAAIANRFKGDAESPADSTEESTAASDDPEPEEYLIPDPGDGAETLPTDADDR